MESLSPDMSQLNKVVNSLNDPEKSILNQKIIILGAGASGLAALNTLLNAGFSQIELLEKEQEPGGVWYTTHYPNLRTHSKSYNYRYLDFYPVKSKTNRATREEIQNYFKEYIDAKALQKYIKFQMNVTEIIYHKDNETNQCELKVVNLKTNDSVTLICDIVICALGFSNAGQPHIPVFAEQESFKGTILHSGQLTSDLLKDIVDNQKSVAVLGAGKSSHEILENLSNVPRDHITWIYQKSLWSFSFEKMHERNSSLLLSYYFIVRRIRKLFKNFNLFLYLLERPLVWSEFVINPIERESDIFCSRAAITSKDQFEYLKKITTIKSTIIKLRNNLIYLSNGKNIKANYLICATGYERAENIPKIFIVDKNKKKYSYDIKLQHSFFRNMIDPNIPNIALFTADIIYPQQILGFSIAAAWLARYYQNGLTKKFSIAEIKDLLEKNKKSTSTWFSESEYLSKGFPYAHHSNGLETLKNIFSDLGVNTSLAKKLYLTLGREKAFEKTCREIRGYLQLR